ncbi:hypothetical protein DMC30DRAFT_391115 [Rhodotorula diobovata]|uniref:Uncharacterized protein n=1 Tax=Rhodotorula diobovata TaxID=5288 RepID=A0A5C5G187_9BASI|nr:hypothetical protein DMC30DRAFT_391115 [Rhodotorula diobovata]
MRWSARQLGGPAVRWMTSPTAAASTIPALQPLVDNFHPELTPQDKRIATVRVRRAFGYWAGGAHLKIRSSDHGLPKLGVCNGAHGAHSVHLRSFLFFLRTLTGTPSVGRLLPPSGARINLPDARLCPVNPSVATIGAFDP